MTKTCICLLRTECPSLPIFLLFDTDSWSIGSVAYYLYYSSSNTFETLRWNCIFFPSMFSLRLTFHLKVSRLNYSQMVFLFRFNRAVYAVGVEEPPVIFILLSSLVTHSKKFSVSSLIHKLLFLSWFFWMNRS